MAVDSLRTLSKMRAAYGVHVHMYACQLSAIGRWRTHVWFARKSPRRTVTMTLYSTYAGLARSEKLGGSMYVCDARLPFPGRAISLGRASENGQDCLPVGFALADVVDLPSHKVAGRCRNRASSWPTAVTPAII